MGPLALLALMVGSLAVAFSADDDADIVAETDPVDDPLPDPRPEADTGATFDADPVNGTVSIELGADETGSLAVFTLLDTQDNEENFIGTYEARYYLVPEGVDLATTDWESQADIPGLDTYPGGPFSYTMSDMEEHLGLELLGVVDLGTENAAPGFPDAEDIASDLPELIANAPADVFFVESATDGDALTRFLPDDFVVTYRGAEAVEVDGNTVGSDATDWLIGTADGITIDGQGGDDRLETSNADATLLGGAGNDVLQVDENGSAAGGDGDDTLGSAVFVNGLYVEDMQPDNVTLAGEVGNDVLRISGGTALGGDGSDTITGWGEHASALHGGAGDDTIWAYGDGVEGFGGEGNDRLGAYAAGAVVHGEAGNDVVILDNGATGFAGAGDDTLQVAAGTTADAGAGDDLIHVWDFHDDELGTAVVTGGAGADTIDVGIRNAFGGPADTPFVRITDFDPEEDVLQIRPWSYGPDSIETVEITEAADGTYSDITVTFAQFGPQSPGVAVVRVDGVTGLTEDDFIILDRG